ncbi:zinc-ribbon domain-containing protein [Novosphingobium sp. FKTRR1]|uniref:zinc-ribbon domain-containing protein n=1 Tax=Novosphingobium sp. FKTRR1 TaxID=2879118 RepID=UPI001CEFE280|nr:zinc-ribbon domain-containing protein [Novosphingobium sp. FKTRR1]
MELSDKERKRLADLFGKLADGGPEAVVAGQMISSMAKRLGVSGGDLQAMVMRGSASAAGKGPTPSAAPSSPQTRTAPTASPKAHVTCPHCRAVSRVPADRGRIRVTCPTCAGAWEWEPGAPVAKNGFASGGVQSRGKKLIFAVPVDGGASENWQRIKTFGPSLFTAAAGLEVALAFNKHDETKDRDPIVFTPFTRSIQSVTGALDDLHYRKGTHFDLGDFLAECTRHDDIGTAIYPVRTPTFVDHRAELHSKKLAGKGQRLIVLYAPGRAEAFWECMAQYKDESWFGAKLPDSYDFGPHRQENSIDLSIKRYFQTHKPEILQDHKRWMFALYELYSEAWHYRKFVTMVRESGGAVLPFDTSTKSRLADLLSAVGALTAHGVAHVRANQKTLPGAAMLLQHMGG